MLEKCIFCETISSVVYTTADDEHVCSDCLEEYFFCCNYCGEHRYHDELSFRHHRHGKICVECEEHFIECDFCYEVLADVECHLFNGQVFCEDCYTDLVEICDNCRGETMRESMLMIDSCHLVCEDCFETWYFVCENCGEVWHIDDRDPDSADNVCTWCADEREELIERYSHTVPRVFYGEAPYFGLEIELECKKGGVDNIAKVAKERAPLEINLKEDGSLEEGFEIVTQPASLGYLQELELESYLKALRDAGARAHDTSTCGLHVHVSRDGLSENQEIKLAILVYSQQRFFTDLARRRPNSYCKYKDLKDKDPEKLNKNWDRHEALNFNNKDTIEFRLFRGTLRTLTLLARIELVHALYHFVQMPGIASADLIADTDRTRAQLIDYIQEHKAIYPNLNTYLSERGWI